jgi:uncharacterized protein
MIDTLLPLMILVFFSNTVESAAGFGATLLALTFGAQFFSIEDLIPILVPLNLLLSLVITLKNQREINAQLLFKRILPLAALGLPMGMILFHSLSGNLLKPLFASIISLLALFELIRIFFFSEKESRPLHPVLGGLFLFFGGVMQGLYASGGPFIVYYASRTFKDKAQFRTTLSALWLILNFFLCSSLIFSRQLTPYTLQFSAYLLPFVLAGLMLGLQVNRWVSEKQFRKIVYFLLLFAGLSLLYRSSIG